MDGARRHSQGGLSLTSGPSSHDPSPPSPASDEKPKRRLWVLLPVFLFAVSRLASFKADAATESFPIAIGETTLNVTIDGHSDAATNSELKAWTENSARGVAAYFGRFPVPVARILMRVSGGGRVSHGRTTPGDPPTIRITVGTGASRQELDGDWVLVHEMIHLGFPDIQGGNHEWMSEGLATYAEPIARVRNGSITLEKFWADMIRFMPQGLPESGENGLANTRSWASTYWGGALFWFLADVQIRQTTGGKRGLEDVLREMNRQGGNFNQSWTVDEFLSMADAEAGTPAMSQLYDQWARQRGSVDLNRLWTRLGVVSVSSRRGGVGFDDSAPLTYVRKSLTGKPPAK